jgi:uncharacterized protein YfaP (DUF2135 family)
MTGEIKNPKAAMYIDGPQKTCAKRQKRLVFHGPKVSVNDDMAGSFCRPHKLFESGAGNSVVDHFRAEPFRQVENRFLDRR